MGRYDTALTHPSYPHPPPPTLPHPFLNIPGGPGGENFLRTLAALTDKCKMIRPVWLFSISTPNSFVVNAMWRQGSNYVSNSCLDYITYVSASQRRAVLPWAPYWTPHLDPWWRWSCSSSCSRRERTVTRSATRSWSNPLSQVCVLVLPPYTAA